MIILNGASMPITTPTQPPVPPFDEASARQKVLAVEATWNTAAQRRIFGPRPDGDTSGLPLR